MCKLFCHHDLTDRIILLKKEKERGRMAGIIAQLTRSARERSLRKNYGANK